MVKDVFTLIVIHVDREKDLRLDNSYDERGIDIVGHIVSSVKGARGPSGLRIEDRIPYHREDEKTSHDNEPDIGDNCLSRVFRCLLLILLNVTDGFINAVKALYDYGQENVGAVYCSGQGGDQGTRALINNLYSGTFTDADHTKYTADTEENIKALELLVGLEGVNFDPAIVGGDEINLFRQGILDMAFCWNIGAQLNTDNNDAGLTNDGDEIVCMAFPSDDGVPELCGGIWGFGIFDNGSEAKIEAAKTFIKYMADSAATADAVKASTYFAVRDKSDDVDLSNIYEGNDIMSEYTKLMPFLGDYYQVVPGWAEARTAWWNMLQQVGAGAGVAESVTAFCEAANAAAGA